MTLFVCIEYEYVRGVPLLYGLNLGSVSTKFQKTSIIVLYIYLRNKYKQK